MVNKRKGIDRRLELVDAPQRIFGDLDRRQIFMAIGFEQFAPVEFAQLAHRKSPVFRRTPSQASSENEFPSFRNALRKIITAVVLGLSLPDRLCAGHDGVE